MKLKDLLLESPTDVVARFYVEASESCDRFLNPENVKYKEENKEFYKTTMKEWFESGVVPVIEKPIDRPQPEYTNIPKTGKPQSAGFRGLQYARARAGIPYDHRVQGPSNSLASTIPVQTMDVAQTGP